MAISTITAWLNGDRLFSDGVKLYLIHGTDQFFKSVLQNGYSKTVHQKLVRELTKLEHTEPEPTEELPQKKYALPADLAELKEKLNGMYSELRLIHAELPKQINQSARRDMCLKIIRDFKTIDAGYELINLYETTGKRPQSTEQVTDSVYTLKRIVDGLKLIPANLTKTRSKLASEKDPERIKVLNERIAAWENELATIQTILKQKADVVIHDATEKK